MDDSTFIAQHAKYSGTGISAAQFAAKIGMAGRTARRTAARLGLGHWDGSKRGERRYEDEYDLPDLPSEQVPVEELKEARLKRFKQRHTAATARKLINVPIRLDGPVGIWLCGDPHVDDDGCDYPQLLADKQTVVDTKGLFGINLGDTTNNWVGRLGRLFANQETSHASATLLAKDFIEGVPWLMIILGNHDMWSGDGLNNPINWMAEHSGNLSEVWRARLNLKFPNGREVRVHPAHDWKGHSMWNSAHGPGKASKMMFRDHILACGHIHDFGYMVHTHEDDVTGGAGISHCIRLPGYKLFDEFGERTGHPAKFSNPYSAVAVIDPAAKTEKNLVTMHFDVQEGAEFLTWKRNRK